MVAGKNFKLEPKFREGIEAGILKRRTHRFSPPASWKARLDGAKLSAYCSMRTNTFGSCARSNATAEAHAHPPISYFTAHDADLAATLMEQASLLGVRELAC